MSVRRPLCILLFSFMLLQPACANDNHDKPIRFATYNIAMGLESEGELYRRLSSGDDEALKKVAAVIQQVRPDVLLINEFDRKEPVPPAALYLGCGGCGIATQRLDPPFRADR